MLPGMTGPDARVGYGPGHELRSEIRPLPVANVNDQLDQFLRWYRSNVRQSGQPQPAARQPFRGFGAQGGSGRPMPEDTRTRGGHGNASFEDQMRALQLRKMQGEVQDAESIRNLRPSPTMLTPAMGGGVIYGYDQQALNPIQRKAVNPENGVMANGGIASSGSAGTPIGADLGIFAGQTGSMAAGSSGYTVPVQGGGAIGNGNTFDQQMMLAALKRSNAGGV